MEAQRKGVEHRIELEGREVDKRRKDEQEPRPAEAAPDGESPPPGCPPPNEGKICRGRGLPPEGRGVALHRFHFSPRAGPCWFPGRPDRAIAWDLRSSGRRAPSPGGSPR